MSKNIKECLSQKYNNRPNYNKDGRYLVDKILRFEK
jgi:hypothetical protein